MSRRLVVTAVVLCLAALAAAAPASFAAPPPLTTSPFTSPDGLWTWSRPLPFGYGLGAMAAPAPGTLFVATSEPDLLVTRDGGVTWAWARTSAVPGFAGPDGVVFTSALDGWTWGSDATGQSVMVLRTTDGGDTWRSSVSVPAAPYGGGVFASFTGPDSGWLVTGGDPDSGPGVLYTTTDGGQTWSAPVTLPFVEEDEGISSFRTLALQGGGQAVLIENDEHFEGGLGVASPMWRTTDAGATWQALATLKGINIRHAVFTSASTGWATNPKALWTTSDGGASWRIVRPAPGNDSLTITGDGIWAIPQWGPAPGDAPPDALHSTDDGATWKKVSGMDGAAVAFADPQDGWMTSGWGSALLRTTNGGTTWKAVTDGPKTAVTGLSAAPDGATVWGAADFVMRSTDAGGSWKRVSSRRHLLAVAARNARDAWAVGRHGVIVHTSDGGSHWSLQASGVSVHLRQVFFVDARHGWVGGDGGALLRTTDGGRHWLAKHFGPLRIGQITFYNTTHGIALLGPDPRENARPKPALLRTSDGGRTWSWVRLQAWPGGVTMLDSMDAVMVSGSTVWSSADGGATWQRGVDLPRPDSYVSLVRRGSQLCAVGASSGGVVTSTDGGVSWAYDGAPAGNVMTMLTSAQFVGAGMLMIGGVPGVLTRDLTAAPLP